MIACCLCLGAFMPNAPIHLPSQLFSTFYERNNARISGFSLEEEMLENANQ
jgi:hypothetical protein